MTVARNVADAIQHHVALKVECIDRLYLNLYQPRLQTPGGAAYFFRGIRGNPVPSSALMAPMTRDFVVVIGRFADERGLDLIRFRKGERKDDRAYDYLRQWRGGEGVLYNSKAQEKARVLRIQASTDPATGLRSTHLGPPRPCPTPTTLTSSTRPAVRCSLGAAPAFPYNAKLCLSGHEYVKRQLGPASRPCRATSPPLGSPLARPTICASYACMA